MARHQLRAKSIVDMAQAQSDEDRLEILYTRQSTTAQVIKHTESLDMQLSMRDDDTIVLIEGLRDDIDTQGMSTEEILQLQKEGKIRGVSGQKRIDQRPQLQKAIWLIKEAKKQGRAATLKVGDTSRLFRTKSRVDVEVFIDVCRDNNVLVQTKQMTYDFRLPMRDEMFRMECSFNRMYLDQQIEKMHEGNRNQARRGEYHGRPLTPGYVIDRDKLLPDGKPNPNYGKYKPYPPHAEVTAHLYSRYRQLGRGRFNVLAAEVASMPFVYPDFETWVDPRDIAQFRLKKVTGGYTMSRTALLNLLTAVEVVGFWKFNGELLTNEDGTPKQNHAGIVPMSDFLATFNDLSWDTLEGEENKSRHNGRATWKPVKKDRQEPLLVGMLSTPGATVQYTGGNYKVMVRRPKHYADSVTLQVNADLVDSLFLCRLQDRFVEHAQATYDRVFEELKRVQADNAQALVSVDEQIARYQASIKQKQDGLATLAATFGANLDKGVAAKMNEDIKHDESELNDLLAKKNSAESEESRLREICEKIDDVLTGACDCETTRRFIKLATDRIELAECSAHFATLTVYWSSPFAAVDVCYIWLENGVHGNWTEQELDRLRELYPQADRQTILEAFPTRSWSSLLSVAHDRGFERNTYKNSSNLPIQLAIRDQEIISLLGFNPAGGYKTEDLWVKDVSVESSAR